MGRKNHREGSKVGETNLEKQLTRIADALEGIREYMKHMDGMMLQASVARKKEASERNSRK